MAESGDINLLIEKKAKETEDDAKDMEALHEINQGGIYEYYMGCIFGYRK